MAQKPIRWVTSALEDLRKFTANARREAGYQLYRVQSGLTPTDWKPMSSVGRGVYEIRVRGGRDYRVFYVAVFEEAVYVLHAFEKRTQKTRAADIELGKKRLAAVQRVRKR
ncbi:MAG: type II toxin-antitoxin system RelE/ParE family toxin [Planctomycetes bacterium]|nr:type II toxin-antitoxin system RelE/ParE family toxin [Planctomycetota bacterium]